METGLDRLSGNGGAESLVAELRDHKVGVLAHPASVTRELLHVATVFEGLGIRPTVYFGPEHGFGGEAQYMVAVEHARDRRGIPVRSLYGDDEEDLVPKARDLADLDVLVIDLQDVGSRYYTFVWTAVLSMRAAAAAGKRTVILDRPNPIGADPEAIEGRSQVAAFRSFVGLESICVRHSLTLGEIVADDAKRRGIDRELLEVVPVRGLEREAHAPDWDRAFVPPSPNMPTYDTALVYPGGCLLEGTNLSEGRGTTRPFEMFGAPFIDGDRLAREFHELELPGVRVRPITFQPTWHKFSGEICGGVQVHPLDRARFLPVATYVALIALAYEQASDKFTFRTERYEFVDNIPAFDLLTGDGQARAMILEGARALDVANTISRPRPTDAERIREARDALSTYAMAD